MTNTIIGFVVFWGIWLLVPLAIDGTTAIVYLFGAWRYQKKTRRKRRGFVLERYPTVAIIIPVHNGEAYLASCLESVRNQGYPGDRLHVIVVDNNSTDSTQVVYSSQLAEPFDGRMDLVSLDYAGKSWALNAGIHVSDADYICNLDSDITLQQNAIMNMVRAFEGDRSLAAATGTIEIAPVDDRDVHPIRRALAHAEYIEYYVAFRIGRQYQSETDSLFTLAGAFSFFRRDVLLKTSLYNNMTVSEDTSLTFEIRQKFPEMRIIAVPEAVAYTEPTSSMSALYAQRVRWQRGEIEVYSIFSPFSSSPWKSSGLATVKSMIINHTLAFPRILWTFLLPLMFMMGYPLGLVISAMLSLYVAYVAIDAVFMTVAYVMADRASRRRLRSAWWVFVILPAFRYVTFWFRVGGFLEVLMEPAQWQVQNPWQQTIVGLKQVAALPYSILSRVLPRKLISAFDSMRHTR